VDKVTTFEQQFMIHADRKGIRETGADVEARLVPGLTEPAERIDRDLGVPRRDAHDLEPADPEQAVEVGPPTGESGEKITP